MTDIRNIPGGKRKPPGSSYERHPQEPESLDFLRANGFGNTIVDLVSNDYLDVGRDLFSNVFRLQGAGLPYRGSNIFGNFAADQRVRGISQDRVGVPLPEEIEAAIADGLMPAEFYSGDTFEIRHLDVGLALDFSRANHDLAIDLLKRMRGNGRMRPWNVDTRYPSLVTGLRVMHVRPDDNLGTDIYGLAFAPYDRGRQFRTAVRHADILQALGSREGTFYFAGGDPGLLSMGLPSEFSQARGSYTRTLTVQGGRGSGEASEDNLGLRYVARDRDNFVIGVNLSDIFEDGGILLSGSRAAEQRGMNGLAAYAMPA